MIETGAIVFAIILLAGLFLIYQDYEFECRAGRGQRRRNQR